MTGVLYCERCDSLVDSFTGMFQDIRQWTNFVYEVHPTVRVKQLLLLYVFDTFYIYSFTINSCLYKQISL